MYIPAKLVLKSYMPKQLEEGMLFITKIHQNTIKEYVEVWKLDKVPLELMEEFITKHGAPVEPYIVDTESEQPIVDSSKIGWWDEGEDVDEFRDIELFDINHAIREWDGLISLMVEEDEEEDFKVVEVEGKVVLSHISLALDEEEDDDDDSFDDDDDEAPDMCMSCNGTGEDVADYPCPMCKGTGVSNTSNWFKDRFNTNYRQE